MTQGTTQGYRIVTGDWAALGLDAGLIRHEVFVLEQQVPAELEMDSIDPACLHVVAYDSDAVPVATGRLLPDAHIGRMAVRRTARGTGLGSSVLTRLMEEARQRGEAEVVLNAQTHAQPFYLRHGFAVEGSEYMEAGIPHVTMRHRFGAGD